MATLVTFPIPTKAFPIDATTLAWNSDGKLTVIGGAATAPATTGGLATSGGATPSNSAGSNGDWRVGDTYPWVGILFKKVSGVWNVQANVVDNFSDLPAPAFGLVGAVVTVKQLNCEFICRTGAGLYIWAPYSGSVKLISSRDITGYSDPGSNGAGTVEQSVASPTSIPAGLIVQGCAIRIRAIAECNGNAGPRTPVIRWGGGWAVANQTMATGSQTTIWIDRTGLVSSSTTDYWEDDSKAAALPYGSGSSSAGTVKTIDTNHNVDATLTWLVKCTSTDKMRYRWREVWIEYPL